jgi:hypothetical protein
MFLFLTFFRTAKETTTKLPQITMVWYLPTSVAGVMVGLLVAVAQLPSVLCYEKELVSLIGDKDGFGSGVLPDDPFDSPSLYRASVYADNDGITDVLRNGDQLNYTHTLVIDPGATVISASLEVMTGGQGRTGLTKVYMNSNLVGTLTNGDPIHRKRRSLEDEVKYDDEYNDDAYDDRHYEENDDIYDDTYNDDEADDGWYLNYARLDKFDLTPFLSTINGSELITIDTVETWDEWVLDYR